MRARVGRQMVFGLVLSLVLLTVPAAGADAAPRQDDLPSWSWPLEGPRLIVAPYRAPAHEYGAGHRGVDIAASRGAAVRSPADGVVAFRGTVVDRPLLTIDHGGGLVTTFEPLLSTLSPGDAVAEGDVIGVVDAGGHAPSGSLHLGVRLDGEYINPMLLFGEVPRAVLLPCCAPLEG
ncbi:murein hydrolase activator EnvC family protein [Microbacterium aurantiacum]|uniref:murein hydrolase activator EnvC family protein n=1 Tax=Microbacterium aurantiacum TaxID=162393 RepID=UPI001FE42D94|nr:M23 family metallopeptidase [Microbacterium aurantiacum]